MRSASFRTLMLTGMMLLAAAATAQSNVNPHTQIRWPANCNHPGMVYNWVTNQCVVTADMSGVAPGPPALCANGSGGALTTTGCTIPAPQVAWPAGCTTGVYSPAANTCVAPGTAANPAGSSGEMQINMGGIFNSIPGSNVDGGANVTFPASVKVGGVGLPTGFATGVVAAPAFYNPHSGVDVIAAGAKGDCVTDDHDAIERAIAAALAIANNPLPLIFPQPPGGCYLTSTLTWQSVSMRGLDQGPGNFATPGTAISLRGKPGQDLWLFPDPNDVSTVINNNQVRVENMQWIGDTSVDVSASHPHRKPGRTLNDGVTNGTTTVTSAHLYCSQGDVGQPVMLTYPDATTQTSTMASCSGTPGNPGTSMTMADAATETQTNVNIYISVAGIPAADTIGNCVFAIDNRDQNNQNWINHNARRPINYSIFHNLAIFPSSGAPQNHSCGVYMQGQLGSGYANTWDHIRMGAFIYGFVMGTSDTNATIGSGSGITGSEAGCDFCRYIDWNTGSQYPFIIYNGSFNRFADIQIGSAYGVQFLGVQTFWDNAPLAWHIEIPEQEQITSGHAGFRLEGGHNIVRNTALEGNMVWDASSSKCESCLINGAFSTFAANGAANAIEFTNLVGIPPANFTSASPSNLLKAVQTSGQIPNRPVAVVWGRNSVAGVKTGQFLQYGGRFFNNSEDLWLIPNDIVWGAGSNVTNIADVTSESGYYAMLPAGGYESWWRSLTSSAVGFVGGLTHAVIGGVNSAMPAQAMTYYLRVKCPVLTSFSLTVPIRRISDQGIQATISLGTQACGTGYSTLRNSVDLSPYDGGLYYPAPNFTAAGEIDIAWDGWVPAQSIPAPSLSTLGGVNSKTCSAGQHISAVGTDGSITCTTDSGGNPTVPVWLQFYGDGSEGALNVVSGTTDLQGEHWYSSVNISVGATVKNAHSYIPIVIRSTGICTIAGTLSNSVNTGSGGNSLNSYWGGSGGGGGGGTGAGIAGNAGFNGAGNDKGTAGTAGGGAGGAGPSQVASNGYLQKIFLGSGTYYVQFSSVGNPLYAGGANGGAGGSSGGAGGLGGGSVILVCPTINLTGTIDVSGGAGTASAGNNQGGGGGGGGGFVIMRSPALTNSGTITVTGGAGGTCAAFTGCGVGGGGGNGWSAVFSQ